MWNRRRPNRPRNRKQIRTRRIPRRQIANRNPRTACDRRWKKHFRNRNLRKRTVAEDPGCDDPACDLDMDELMDPCCVKDKKDRRRAARLYAELNEWDPARRALDERRGVFERPRAGV